MSLQNPRTSRKYTSSAPRFAPQPDLHHAASDKRTRHPPRNSPPPTPNSRHNAAHIHPSSKNTSSSSSKSSRRNSKMGQPPQQPPPQNESLLALYANMQALEANKELELHMQSWGMVTIIEDDDLTFGGKPLSTWYEEDRRRYSLGEESLPSSPGLEDDEEERRGRQRDRPQYYRPSQKHSEKPAKSEGQENRQ